MWLTILNRLRKVNLLLVASIISAVLFLFSFYQTKVLEFKRDIRRLEFNVKMSNANTTHWENSWHEAIAQTSALESTVTEILATKDVQIQTMTEKARRQGLKIKDLEYLVSIGGDFNMDSIVPIVLDTVHFTRDNYIYIDSISVGDFRLKRTQAINSLESHYNINYTPTLYLSISHYKDGPWRVRNIFHKRDIRYRATITSSDNLLKPKELKIIKVD